MFDVAVTANAEASGNIGAEVFSIWAKTAGKIGNEEISRVKCVVKVGHYFPKPKPSDSEMLEELKKNLANKARSENI